jgi:hypothetical protein
MGQTSFPNIQPTFLAPAAIDIDGTFKHNAEDGLFGDMGFGNGREAARRSFLFYCLSCIVWFVKNEC